MAEAFDPEARPERARAARMARIAFALLCVGLALATAFYLVVGGDAGEENPGVLTAESAPERLPPDPTKPNGAQIPHTDQSVYDIVGREEAVTRREGLAPAAEAPLPAPGAPTGVGVATAPTGPVPGGPVQLLPPNPAPDRINPPPAPSLPPPPDPRAVQRATLPPAPSIQPSVPPGPAALPPAPAPPPEAVAALPPGAAEAPPQRSFPPLPPRRPAAFASVQPEAPLEAAPEPPPPAARRPAVDASVSRGESGALPPESTFLIQIGAVRSKAIAQREWRRLRSSNSDILGGMQLFIQEVDISGRGTFHRLQAGPLPDPTLAEIACGQLKSRNVGCFVVAK